MKEKVVIVTLYDSINCGTFLQAHSLGLYLKEIGFEPAYLKLKNNNSNLNVVSRKTKRLTIKEIFIKAIRKILLKIKFNSMDRYFNVITLDEVNNDESIKYIIIGSDEIWNVHNKSFIHYKEFFGYNFFNKKIIAYAPSCNDILKDDVLKYDSGLNFENFSCLSARDEKTYNLLKDFENERVQKVLDPTFLIDSYKKTLTNIKLKNYIIVYGHEFNDDQIKTVKEIAKKKDKKLVSITKYYSWCDKNLIATPFEFLSYIKHADYVITSTFHGSVFSILFEKSFICFVEKENKVSDLLKKFNLEDRIFKNSKDGLKKLDESIDYNKVNDLKEKYKKESTDYLLKSLDMVIDNE